MTGGFNGAREGIENRCASVCYFGYNWSKAWLGSLLSELQLKKVCTCVAT